MDEIKNVMYKKELLDQEVMNTNVKLRTVLINAIKMQSLYTGGKIKLIEASSLIN